jgi:hypothetical protein
LPGTVQISEELIQAGNKVLCCEILTLPHSVWNKEELPQHWKESVTLPIYKMANKTDCSNY